VEKFAQGGHYRCKKRNREPRTQHTQEKGRAKGENRWGINARSYERVTHNSTRKTNKEKVVFHNTKDTLEQPSKKQREAETRRWLRKPLGNVKKGGVDRWGVS